MKTPDYHRWLHYAKFFGTLILIIANFDDIRLPRLSYIHPGRLLDKVFLG